VRFFISLILLILAPIIMGQTIIDGKGNLHAKRAKRTQEPKVIVDTVRMSAGIGTMTLKKESTRKQHSTAPTASTRMYPQGITQILLDTSDAVNRYAFFINTTRDTVVIKSSQTDDSGLVAISLFVK
jgi:hypothetical protein